jgi:hypothetical protein
MPKETAAEKQLRLMMAKMAAEAGPIVVFLVYFSSLSLILLPYFHKSLII